MGVGQVIYVGASPYPGLYDPVGVFIYTPIYTLIYTLITLSASAVFLYFISYNKIIRDFKTPNFPLYFE